MRESSFTILVGALVLMAWGAVWLSHRRAERRRRARQAEWEELARCH